MPATSGDLLPGDDHRRRWTTTAELLPLLPSLSHSLCNPFSEPIRDPFPFLNGDLQRHLPNAISGFFLPGCRQPLPGFLRFHSIGLRRPDDDLSILHSDGGLVEADSADVPHIVDARLPQLEEVAVSISVT